MQRNSRHWGKGMDGERKERGGRGVKFTGWLWRRSIPIGLHVCVYAVSVAAKELEGLDPTVVCRPSFMGPGNPTGKI